jgi:hypothetical protein
MSEHRNTSPYGQRRAQTYNDNGAGSSANPYDGVEMPQGDAKQTMANRAQSLRHSSESITAVEGVLPGNNNAYNLRSDQQPNHGRRAKSQ